MSATDRVWGEGETGRFVARELGRGAAASRYAVWVPGDAETVTAPLPVVLFLHGAGEVGTDGIAPTTVGLGPVLHGEPEPVPRAGGAPEMSRADLPASPRVLAVFPQSRPGRDWTSRESAGNALAALDAATGEFGGDPARQILTGVSMGGSGAWHLALRERGRWAALAPVCGWLARESVAGEPPERLARGPYAAAADALGGVPTWVFHGDADRIVPVEASRVMVEALREAGRDVRYTEYAGVGHASWRQAYAEPELYRWLNV